MANATEPTDRENLDLRPTLEFVARHMQDYETGFKELLDSPTQDSLKKVKFPNFYEEEMVGIQLIPISILHIIIHLPKTFLHLSELEMVDYKHAGEVPVPIFDPMGKWNRQATMVNADLFPREGDHPSIILIGYSTGKEIYPTALPRCVFENPRVRWLYQLHVFLHEYFHTIELLRRTPELRSQVILHGKDGEFTLQEWWQAWEDWLLSDPQPKSPSRYAATYRKSLTREMKKTNEKTFAHSLAEQICESAVGYVLGIVPNDDNNSDFREHSPVAWNLINDLATATVVGK